MISLYDKEVESPLNPEYEAPVEETISTKAIILIVVGTIAFIVFVSVVSFKIYTKRKESALAPVPETIE